MSRYIPKAVKDEVKERDRNRCVKCGSRDYLEYDHITPYKKGVPNTAEFIQLLCRRCNSKKRDKTGSCKKCGSWVPHNAIYCQSCGRSVPKADREVTIGSERTWSLANYVGLAILICVALYLVVDNLAPQLWRLIP